MARGSSDSDFNIDDSDLDIDDRDFDIDDNDLDIDDYGEIDASPVGKSANSRIRPSRALTHGTGSRNSGYNGQSQQPRFNRAYISNGSSSNVHTQCWDSFRGTASENLANGKMDKHRMVNSRNSIVSDTDCRKLLSQHSFKRILPSSFQVYPPIKKSNNFLETAANSQTRDSYGNTYHPSRSSLINRGDYRRDIYSKSSMYANNGKRILSPSLTYGKTIPSMQYPSPSNVGQQFMPDEEKADADDERLVYQAALQDLYQTKVEASLPDGLLSVSLLRYQKIALAWMVQKESRSTHCLGGILADEQGLGKTISVIALIQMQRFMESKQQSGVQCSIKAEALNLEDDDNGSCTVDKDKQCGESVDNESVPKVSTSKRPRGSWKRASGGTLVVCPASVLRQWARELAEKVGDDAKLSYLVYHGGSRTKDPDQLAKYDVVLTTYAIVTHEVPKQPLVDEEAEEKFGVKYGVSSEFSINKKRKNMSWRNRKKKKGKGMDSSGDIGFGALARVTWLRVVLDEAQTIKNHRTQVARACCSLRAKRRWCLSGTPIQNSIDDLYSYCRFLRFEPYALYKSFYNAIKVPISRNSLQGYKKLQAVLRLIMLRRTKGTLIDGEPIIKLPPKCIRLIKVEFSFQEQVFYARLENDSGSKFKAYAAAGTVSQNYANILLLLLRLRQACDHPLLVKGFNSDSVGKVSTEMAKKLPRNMVIGLLNRFATSLAICLVCSDPPEDPVVTICGHVFCYQCVAEYLTGDDNTCPASHCEEQLGSDVVFSEATLRSCISKSLGAGRSHSNFDEALQYEEHSSSKIRALIKILQSHCKAKNAISEINDFQGCNASETVCSNSNTEEPIKTIVFSQWTGMLDLVEKSLDQYSIQYRRLDGRMTLTKRDRAVTDFNTDPEVTVMLVSLKAGNLGLNMVSACHVILLDLWWNPTTEDQAIDRAHRIGQTRPVTVTRLTVKGTLEDRILALQEEKRKLVASAFGEDHSGGSATRLTVEDLKYLFNVSNPRN